MELIRLHRHLRSPLPHQRLRSLLTGILVGVFFLELIYRHSDLLHSLLRTQFYRGKVSAVVHPGSSR